MTTFKDLKTGPVGRASGLDVEGCEFLQICNDAVRQLMNRGQWWSTVVPIQACARNGLIVWPRGVGTILGLNICGQQTALENLWFRYMQPDSYYSRFATEYARRGWFGSAVVESRSTACSFNPIVAAGFTLRIFITNPADIGKKITFFGSVVGGSQIITTRQDGTIQPGIEIAMRSPFIDLPIEPRHISRVIKDETSGPVMVYQKNIEQGFLLEFGQYQPSETNPDYITTAMGGGFGAGCVINVESLVKLDYVPFKYDQDLVQIDCMDAIRDMVMSIRKKDSSDIGGSVAFEKSAFRELNFQMRERYPDEQFVVDFRPFGRDSLNGCRVNIGQL